MKILHLPSPVSGLGYNLSQGEQLLGFDSQSLVTFQNWLNYPADINLNLNTKHKISAVLSLINTFVKIRDKYDVFHFNFGSSLLHFPTRGLLHLELPYYSKHAKKFVTYSGCDARQKYPTMERTPIAACHNIKCYKGQCNSGHLDTQRRKAIDKMALHVDHIWAHNPDLLFFLPPEKTTFLPYAVNPEKFPLTPFTPKYPLKIVHAPTNREAKGSDYILNALHYLKNKHPHKIEIVLVENIPHEEAITLYKNADLIIDQLMIGWYGVVAIEAMMLGKPVVTRIAQEYYQFLPDDMVKDIEKSFINADPFNIEGVLEKYIQDIDLLKEKSELAYKFAMKWHDYKTVAQLTTSRYTS